MSKAAENLDEKTVLADSETSGDEEPKEKKKSRRTRRSTAFSPDELEEKLDLIFKAAAKFTHREYVYKPRDFKQEASALQRMTDKFPIVGDAIKLLDPILLLLGLVTKFLGMKRQEPTEESQPEEETAEENGVYSPQPIPIKA